ESPPTHEHKVPSPCSIKRETSVSRLVRQNRTTEFSSTCECSLARGLPLENLHPPRRCVVQFQKFCLEIRICAALADGEKSTTGNDRSRNSTKVLVKSRSPIVWPLSYIEPAAGTVVASEKGGGVETARNTRTDTL